MLIKEDKIDEVIEMLKAKPTLASSLTLEQVEKTSWNKLVEA